MAISPQTPEKNAEVREKQRLSFPVLSDRGNAYANELSIGFTAQDYLKETYEGFGIDLESHNGDDSWRLPVPTRIVVDAAGRVRSIEADPDYTHRPEPAATLAVVRELTDGA